MKSQFDPDVTIAAWLEDGPLTLPAATRQVVVASIHVTPQRRKPLVRLPWRLPDMSTPLRVGMAAVIGLLLLGAGIYIFGGSGPDVGGRPAATPTPSPSPVPTAVTARLASVGQVGPTPASVLVTVPPGWGPSYGYAVGRLDIAYEPQVGVWQIGGRFKDPCSDHSLLDPAPGPGVDDLLTALASQPGITAGPITDVTIDGYRGKSVELTAAIDPRTCGSGEADFWLWASPNGGLYDHYFVGDTTTANRVYALDIDGTRFTFFARIPAGTTAEDLAALETIIDSFDIEPAPRASPSP